jgi:hypothetical protein
LRTAHRGNPALQQAVCIILRELATPGEAAPTEPCFGVISENAALYVPPIALGPQSSFELIERTANAI